MNIWGRYKDHKPEKIDSTLSIKEAMRLANEYRIAFGKDWSIWIGTKNQSRIIG